VGADAGRVRRAGFTLIELLIVVGVIGVLVAIAIPTFQRFHLRAKTSEAKTNLAALRTAEEAYMGESGTYLATFAVPGVIPGNTSEVWPAGTPFDDLGFRPEGSVYFQYLVSADNGGAGTALIRYTAEAAADLDADGLRSFWALVRPVAGATTGLPGALPGSACAATGTWNPATNAADLLHTVGPCDPSSGRSEF
jgi:prepilin-type N-terminal cleavage/methylation domain-containing protein